MAQYRYSKQNIEEEHTAKAVGISLPISTKQSIEVCNFIRNKPLERAKTMLNDVILTKIAVPFKRFKVIGHKRGNMASGRYPIKTSKEILGVLESAEANAQFKGLNTSNLFICHISSQKAGNQWHYGRQKRRKMKRTTIEVVLQEKASDKKQTKENKKDKTSKKQSKEAKK